MYFDLGVEVGTNLTQLSAHVEYASLPTGNFTDGPRVNYAVENATYNAEGVELEGSSQIAHLPNRPGPIIPRIYELATMCWYLMMSENVQCATNQCFPMALANMLKYLKNRYGLPVPHSHVPGLKGDDSLVGQMDTYTNRYVVSRTYGGGVNLYNGLIGLVDYLNANGLLSKVTISYQSNHTLSGFSGDLVRAGITVPDESVSGKVTYDWIKAELLACESIVMCIAWHGGGGHAVRVYGCGETGGVPFLWYADDKQQTGQGDPTDTLGLEWVQVYVPDADGDGNPDCTPNTGNEIFAAISVSRIWLLTDITYNGKVDMQDIILSVNAFGAQGNMLFLSSPNPLSPRWNPAADVNRDAKNDMRDIASICRDFGKSTLPWP
jgi:hypothetical protein